jgi:hypothetical protein
MIAPARRSVKAEVNRYYDAANELSRKIREFQFDSIDEVLRWFSLNLELIALGKAAIVREIILAERAGKIFNDANPDVVRDFDRALTWTPYLLWAAVGSLPKEEVRDAFSNIVTINFNYDRVIEHYL